MSDTFHRASEAAQRAHDLLAQRATLDSYDWLLVATLLVEADEALERAKQSNPAVELPLLDEVVEELRDATENFTKPDIVICGNAGAC
ncbi:hypothetical protein [Sphingosinicella sp. BN140058]|uniref:hypothetical protein n=1 Tax=Sphingosinicella sp. BN140058 TaxID=1892855 RepID=UPI001011139E|nr:hypothetical protein [Sphingosinicella sp. BN140058]QAY75405.1 hypothetical protein ETR14_01830 [Sphingosinicella sp. BN140058]